MFDALRDQKQVNLNQILSKAHQEVAGQCYDALGEVILAIVERDKEREEKAKKALDMALQAMRMATSLGEKLREVPEASVSPIAEKLKQPATDEEALQRQLLDELAVTDDVRFWYTTNRRRIEQVQRASLRNPLFDAIRSRV